MPRAPWLAPVSLLLLLLLAATPRPAFAADWRWEWRRQSITAEDRAEIRRIDLLSRLTRPQLDAVAESERAATNHQVMMQYNGALPTPMPMLPTPEVRAPQRSPFRFFHN